MGIGDRLLFIVIVCILGVSEALCLLLHVQIQEYLEDKPELKKLGDEMTRKQEWGVLKE